MRRRATRWIQVFSADETGGDTVVEGGSDEGVSVWEAGEVYMAGEEADPQPEGHR